MSQAIEPQNIKKLKKILQNQTIAKPTQQILLKLARHTLEYWFKTHKIYTTKQAIKDFKIDANSQIYKELLEKRATFVTLKLQHQLRGCIGHLQAINPLVKDVIQNSLAAAFQDPRFLPLTQEELPYINIEISVLTPQFKLKYASPNELLNFLNTYHPGVTINLQDQYTATFLPSVWEELPNEKDFLNHLCAKAGLPIECYKNYDIEVYVYFAQEFREE